MTPAKRAAALTGILSFTLLAPEVINVGIMFLRWDHVVLGVLLPAIWLARTRASRTRTGTGLPAGVSARATYGGSPATALLIVGVVLFAAYQLLAIPEGGSDRATLVKYALSPLKVLGWAVLVREMFAAFRLEPRDGYRLVVTTAGVVLCMQIGELTFEPFRRALFALYPVAESSQTRLADLAFRARGPFSGYDVASIFFALAGVIICELRPVEPRGLRRWLPIVACIGGALLAARTGFVLLLAYLAIRGMVYARNTTRIAAVATGAALALAIWYAPEGEEGTLTGRYMEMLAGIRSGDLTSISSVSGTLNMNENLATTHSEEDALWGAGLDAGTTADQLYAKYYYMLGVVGAALWCGVHLIVIVGSGRRWARGSGATRRYGRVACIIGVMIAVAHWKGGNYYFAARSGEFAVLFSMLGLAPIPMLRRTAS